MATKSAAPQNGSAPSYLGPFITVTALYFIFGFITNLNMQLVPHLKSVFNLLNWQAALANGVFFLAYFIMSTPTSWLIDAIGYKKTMVVALFVQVAGALLFLPASSLPNFWLFLLASFVVGSGVAALQTAANPYVSALGPEHSAPFRQTLAQTFNSVGGVVAPMVASALILQHSHLLTDTELKAKSAAELLVYQAGIASTVRTPYLVIAAILAVLGIAVSFAHLPVIRASEKTEASATDSIWKYRHTVLATVAIFLYVGVEVGLAQYMVGYFGLPELGGLAAATAAGLTAYYWSGALVGRILGSAVLTKLPAGPLVGVFGLCAALCVVASQVTSGHVAMGALLACGFFNSIMFPSIFALGITGLGPMTSKGSGMIMTAVVGGAVIPVTIGWLIDRVGYRPAAILPVFCYAFIAFYGFVGHKPTQRTD